MNKDKKTSISQEDYLKAIWELRQEGQIPIGARIAEELKVSAPAVTLALKRLSKDGYVTVDKNNRIYLTGKGEETASHLVRRHQLVEKLLTDFLNMEWYKVHDEAEKLEHAISPEMEERLLQIFGKSKTCPHGYPLLENRRGPGDLKPLHQAQSGQTLRISKVYEKDRKFLEYLDKLGITPGTKVYVNNKGYDGTFALKIGERIVHLGGMATNRIWVKILSKKK